MNARIKSSKPNTTGLNIAGHIRIGEKGEKGYPTSLDYFKVDGATEEYNKIFTSVYGDKPTTITIAFLSNNMADICRQYLELRDSAGKRVAHGDGEQFLEAQNVGGRVVDVPIFPHDVDEYMNTLASRHKSEWKERLTLRFAILGVPIIGVWQLTTGGKESSIKNITACIDVINDQFGRVMGLPFDLNIEKVKSDKSGSKSSFPVLTIVGKLSLDSIDAVRQLPMNGSGILTESRLGKLSSGDIMQGNELPTGASSVESGAITDIPHEEVSSEPAKFDAAKYLSHFVLNTVGDINTALSGIIKSTAHTNEEKTAVFYLLEAKAEALNAGYDKVNKVFACR